MKKPIVKVGTDQFTRLKIRRLKPVRAVECWTAVYANHGNHVVISAPNLDALDKVYKSLTGILLKQELAEHTLITEYRKSDAEAV